MPLSRTSRAIVLAAGGSTRMGRPKGLLLVEGVPLVCLHVARFLGAGLDVTVVLGAHAEEYAAALGARFPAEARCTLVYNHAWASTAMADSLSIAHRDGAALVTPVDVPPARPETLAALLAVEGDAVASYHGAPGHPIQLSAPLGPGQRLDERLALAARVDVADPDCLLNLNTPAEWARWRAG